MSAQLFLIAPPQIDAARLAPVLAQGGVSALLLRRGGQSENGYKSWVRTVVPVAQAAGCAVLIEGEPGWAKALDADGVHVSGPLEAVSEAVDALKPGMIVGADATRSRHEAMERGELDIDYLLFGPMTGVLETEDLEMAAWWSDLTEIPAVLCDPAADPASADPQGCDFLGVSDSLWNAPEGPESAAAAFALRLEAIP